MKLNQHILLFFSLLVLGFACESPTVRPKAPLGQFTYGGEGEELATGIVALPNDAGYLLVGGQKEIDKSEYDLFLIQTDIVGNEVFSRAIGTKEADEVGWKILRNQAGEYVIFGTKRNTSDQQYLVQMTFLDANFDLIRQEETRGIFQVNALSLRTIKFYELSGGGYFAAGSQEDIPFMIKLEANGHASNFQLFSNYHVPRVSEFVTRRPDGGFAMAVQFRDNFYDSDKIRFVMFDAQGVFETETFITTTSQGNMTFGLTAFSDSTYRLFSRSGYSYATEMIHFDQNLNVLRETEFTNTNNYFMVRETQGGRIFLGGFHGVDEYVYDPASQQNLLFQTLGRDHREARNFERGGPELERVYDMVLASNGKFAAVGHTTSFGEGGSDAYLLFVED